MLKVSKIRLEWTGGDKPWKLLDPVVLNDVMGCLTVPVGFKTDLASIPRLLWAIIPPFGPHIWAAVIHDYLYASTGLDIDRVRADAIFLAIMKAYKVPAWKRGIMYAAVRVFGGRSFKVG